MRWASECDRDVAYLPPVPPTQLPARAVTQSNCGRRARDVALFIGFVTIKVAPRLRPPTAAELRRRRGAVARPNSLSLSATSPPPPPPYPRDQTNWARRRSGPLARSPHRVRLKNVPHKRKIAKCADFSLPAPVQRPETLSLVAQIKIHSPATC